MFFSLPAFSTGGQGCLSGLSSQVVGNAMSQTWSDRHRILLVTRARQRLKNWGVSAGAMAADGSYSNGHQAPHTTDLTELRAIKPSSHQSHDLSDLGAELNRYIKALHLIALIATGTFSTGTSSTSMYIILWTSLLSCRDAFLLVTTDKTLSKTAGTVIVDDGGTLGLHDIAPHPAATFHQSRSVQFVKATCRGYSRSSIQMATVTLSCTFEP